MPYQTLNDWRFDDPNWSSYAAQAPLLFLNVSPVEIWSGYAVSFGGLEPAWLVLPVVDDNGEPNLNPTAGTLQFWFSPYWSSAAAGGKGPGPEDGTRPRLTGCQPVLPHPPAAGA